MKKNNKTNLIFSIISLLATSFLLVFTIYSWYTANTEVSSRGITARSSDDQIIEIAED